MIDTLDPNGKRKRNSKKNMPDIPNVNYPPPKGSGLPLNGSPD